MHLTNTLRTFGFLVGTIFVVLSGVFFWNAQVLWVMFAGVGAVLLVTALFHPLSLHLFYRIWMGIAVALGFVMSRVILSLFFYGVFTLTRVIGRAFGNRFLDVSFKTGEQTYWRMRGEALRDYERQF